LKRSERARSFMRVSLQGGTRTKLMLIENLGTHNFHNFTIGLEHSDPSALRYMISIDVELFFAVFFCWRTHLCYFVGQGTVCARWNRMDIDHVPWSKLYAPPGMHELVTTLSHNTDLCFRSCVPAV
jgi:hypothetical protein